MVSYWEDSDAEIVGYAFENVGYEFNEFVVLSKDGVFYWANDAGCSCASPFDKVSFPGDFGSSTNPHDVLKALNAWADGAYSHVEAESLRSKLMAA